MAIGLAYTRGPRCSTAVNGRGAAGGAGAATIGGGAAAGGAALGGGAAAAGLPAGAPKINQYCRNLFKKEFGFASK